MEHKILGLKSIKESDMPVKMFLNYPNGCIPNYEHHRSARYKCSITYKLNYLFFSIRRFDAKDSKFFTFSDSNPWITKYVANRLEYVMRNNGAECEEINCIKDCLMLFAMRRGFPTSRNFSVTMRK